MLTKDQTPVIQRETRSQSYSPLWCEERRCGITNSLLGQVCRWFSSTQPDCLVNSIKSACIPINATVLCLGERKMKSAH